MLKKSLYGFKPAAKSWNDAIHTVLIDAGFQQSKADQCLYSRKKNGEWAFLLIYVDDIIIVTKSIDSVNDIMNSIASKFALDDLGDIKFYLGMEVTRDVNHNYYICQSKDIEKVAADFGLSDAKELSVPMNVNKQRLE